MSAQEGHSLSSRVPFAERDTAVGGNLRSLPPIGASSDCSIVPPIGESSEVHTVLALGGVYSFDLGIPAHVTARPKDATRR